MAVLSNVGGGEGVMAVSVGEGGGIVRRGIYRRHMLVEGYHYVEGCW